MKIWIVTIYEPLPFGDQNTRPQRCGMLAKALLDRGHIVELWTSAFDHVSHSHIFKISFHQKIDDYMSIQFVNGCGYQSDRSLKRLFHNRQTATEFASLAYLRKDSPDIIFAPVPILELSQASVDYGVKKDIPVIVDIRDLWPDVYLTMIPKVLHPIGRRLLYAEFRRAKYIFKNAAGITAVSKTYLEKGLFYAQRGKNLNDSFFPLGSSKLAHSDLVPPADEDDSILRRYNIMGRKQFIVTYVGTFSKFCDIQNILDAAKLIKDNNEIKIFIVGDGDRCKAFFKTASQLPNVTMTGWLNSTAVSQILQNTSVGLVAYAKNAIMSLPNKPFEYMAAGLPLLSSLPGELNQLMDENGIGRPYEAGNPVSLAEGILWFFNHPKETVEMGKRSKFLFMKKFDSEVVYKELVKHLESVSSGRLHRAKSRN